MKIYIDSEFKCHISNDGGMRAVETEFFNGKNNSVIENYRFVPEGESWTREDGVVFYGEMVAPWKEYREPEEISVWDELDAAYQEGVDSI